MPNNRSCPKCNRRLPYAARRCVHCDWSSGGGPDIPQRSAWGRARLWVLVLALAGAAGGGLLFGNAEAVSTWYANFAARYLPASLSSFAPRDTETGAFFYCARQVSRRMDGEFSVETFASPGESRTRQLGEGRYEIESFVDEAREDGARVRHGFTCTVRYQRGRWVLEELRLENYAERRGEQPRLGMRTR